MHQNTFREILLKEEDFDLYEFNKALQILELNMLNEGFLDNIKDKLSSGIKKKINFIKEIAKVSGQSLKNLITLFKNSQFFTLFKTIGFNLKKLGQLFKKGLSVYNSIQDIIAKKIYELGGVKYIHKHLKELDEFFNSHPVIKKVGGIAVAGLLLYIWLNMSYDPIDIEWSLSFEDMIKALAGSFSLAQLFATPAGVKMLVYLVVGMATGGVWYYPGSQMSQILTGVIYGAWKTIVKDKSVKIPRPKLKKIK